jgi:AraC family transcriptional regulator, L-rhamnose operon transcriptional activator RhaR
MNHQYTLDLNRVTLNQTDKFLIQTFSHDDMETHNHNFFELVYMINGSTNHSLNGIASKLSPGDYFIVDYGSVHSYSNSKDLQLINCLFQPEIIDDTLEGCRSFESLLHVSLLRYHKLYSGKTPANRIFSDTHGQILLILKGMIEEYEAKQVGYTEIFRNRLLEILILTMRKVVDTTTFKSDRLEISEAIHYFNSHYQEHTLLTRFCAHFHYSPQYISRRFKEDTGFTITDYLHKLRIEKSCELLAGSDLSITDIAELVGYSDVKFFNKLFRKLIKLSPTAYRKLSL